LVPVLSLSHDGLPSAFFRRSLHDALPISDHIPQSGQDPSSLGRHLHTAAACVDEAGFAQEIDFLAHHPLRPIETCGEGPPTYGRSEETRLNSSHVKISYAVFCLKKKRTRE